MIFVNLVDKIFLLTMSLKEMGIIRAGLLVGALFLRIRRRRYALPSGERRSEVGGGVQKEDGGGGMWQGGKSGVTR